MNLYSFLPLPFVLQGLAMMADEFYFHHKRGLPKWERWGHPIDTLTVFMCFLWLLLMPPTDSNLGVYMVLASISCLVITKDEFVHKDLCTHQEMWLHSLLFVLHPLVFLSAGWIWRVPPTSELAFQLPAFAILWFQIALLLIFLLYQIIYWNFYEPKRTSR